MIDAWAKETKMLAELCSYPWAIQVQLVAGGVFAGKICIVKIDSLTLPDCEVLKARWLLDDDHRKLVGCRT